MPEVSGNGKGGTDGSPLKTKPRATFSPGNEPVKFQDNYG